MIMHWLYANEGLLNLHTWPEGSISYVGSAYQNPPGRLQERLALYCKINTYGIRLVLP